MRRPLLGTCAAAVLIAGAAAVGAPTAAAQSEAYIVVLKSQVDPSAKVVALERSLGFSSTMRFRTSIRGFAARMTTAVRDRIASDPDVAFVALDRPVSAQPASNPLAAGESAPTGVLRIGGATTELANGAATAAVAVIDTGIDLLNSDLNATAGIDCTSTGGTSQDANGHGTHVAGIIGARNTGTGVVGVAPGTKLYSVKVLDAQGNGTFSQVICGIDWVTANASALNIKVANLSLSGSGTNDNNCGNSNGDPLHLAVCRSTAQGVTYVSAAGNANTRLTNSAPAVYPEVLAVTAMSDSDGQPGAQGPTPTCRTGERDDAAATFSNYAFSSAERSHTVAAPGVCITSTQLGGGVTTLSGTSMAAPHVAAAVAQCVSPGGACAGLTPAQVIQKVRGDAAARGAAYGYSGDPVNNPGRNYYGYLAHADITDAPPPPVEPEPEPCRTSSLGGGC